MDREAQDLGREPGRVGEGIGSIAPIGSHRLVVDGARVVDGGEDRLLPEALGHAVTELSGEPHGVLVVDVARALVAGEGADLVGAREALVIARGERAAAVGPGVEVRELGAQGAGLEGGQARVRADAVVAVLLPRTVVAELSKPRGDFVTA